MGSELLQVLWFCVLLLLLSQPRCTFMTRYILHSFIEITALFVSKMCKGATILCEAVCSECVTCLCLCVFAVFQNLVCIHVDNYNFMEIFFPPFLTTTSAAEANSRGRVEAKLSGSLSLFLPLSLCCLPLLSPSLYPSFLLSLIFLRGPDHLRLEPWVDPEPLLSAQVYSNVP